MSQRSHRGCVRCKRRRQKCDENKPACDKCRDSHADCEYSITLKWNGRVPRVKKDDSSSEKGLELTRSALELSSRDVLVRPAALQAFGMHTILQNRTLSSLDGLSMPCKRILHHWVTKASMVATHEFVRDKNCSDSLQHGQQSMSTLYATLALSAIHHSTILNGTPENFVPEPEVMTLLSLSMQHLRQELNVPTTQSGRSLLYTIRLLCTCAIFSGQANSTWRTHVRGAQALLEVETSRENRVQQGDLQVGSNSWLVNQWLISIEALAALTKRGSLKNRLVHEPSSEVVARVDAFFDIYAGYYPALHRVFDRIGVVSLQQRQISGREDRESRTQWSLTSNDHGAEINVASMDIHFEAERLEYSLIESIRQDNAETLNMPPNITFNAVQLQQFAACNHAYQYSALINVYRRLFRLPRHSAKVQTSVKHILDAVITMLPVVELSPWILLTTPLYVAGCNALDGDRDQIKSILMQMYSILHIRNIQRTLHILERKWQGSLLNFTEDSASDMIDFIPY